jgi:nucleoside-diphosphate-sugar epimerase
VSKIKIFITGGRGFIGSNLVLNLISHHSITVLLKPNTELGFKHNKLIEFHYNYNLKDLIDYFSQENFDVVIHLASFSPMNHNYNDVDEIINSNIKLGLHILEAARYSKTKNFIYTSSHWQYYHSNKFKPANLYAASKESYEKFYEYYVSAEKFNVVNLLIYETFSENDLRRKILNLLKDAIIKKEVLDITHAEQLLNFVHIDDIVKGVKKAIDLLANKVLIGINNYGLFADDPIKLIDVIKKFKLEKYVNIGAKPYRNREVMYPSYPFARLPNWKPEKSIMQRLEFFFNRND